MDSVSTKEVSGRDDGPVAVEVPEPEPPRQIAPPDPVESSPRLRAFLYDAEGWERDVSLEQSLVDGLTKHQLLWVDVDLDHPEVLQELASCFPLDQESMLRMQQPIRRPRLEDFDEYLHLSVLAVKENETTYEPLEIECLISHNWIITGHHGKLPLVELVTRPFKRENQIGELNGTLVLAILLDWHLNSYFQVLEDFETRIDRLDEDLLGHDTEGDELVDQLISMRRQITQMRRIIAPHRDVFAALIPASLTHDGLFKRPRKEAETQLHRLSERLERAIEAVEGTRVMLMGSFDIFMTQTAERTNDVMKRLTLISVLLLPSIVIAGIMGMNFKVSLFDHARLFWVIILAMAALALLSFFVAWRRRWL
jgi:magnesium transporter